MEGAVLLFQLQKDSKALSKPRVSLENVWNCPLVTHVRVKMKQYLGLNSFHSIFKVDLVYCWGGSSICHPNTPTGALISGCHSSCFQSRAECLCTSLTTYPPLLVTPENCHLHFCRTSSIVFLRTPWNALNNHKSSWQNKWGKCVFYRDIAQRAWGAVWDMQLLPFMNVHRAAGRKGHSQPPCAQTWSLCPWLALALSVCFPN